jgi:hypothetical protein
MWMNLQDFQNPASFSNKDQETHHHSKSFWQSNKYGK